MRRVILRNHQSPGDLVVFSGALRDLHRTHPGAFQTALDTSCPAIFEHNPYVVPAEMGMEVIPVHYPSVLQANHSGLHFIEGFRNDLAALLGVTIEAGPLHGDIHLTPEERENAATWRDERPTWLINAGGKNDFTCKQWPIARWQQVVDALPEVHFVQVGAMQHNHPRLERCTCLVGQTTLRQLIVLCAQADGIVCGVTATMHLAACFQKPCVVVAGGREPRTWEAYSGHAYLSNNAEFPCCTDGTGWKWRVQPLHDGLRGPDNQLLDSRLCVAPVEVHPSQFTPACLDAIRVEQVVAAIRSLCHVAA